MAFTLMRHTRRWMGLKVSKRKVLSLPLLSDESLEKLASIFRFFPIKSKILSRASMECEHKKKSYFHKLSTGRHKMETISPFRFYAPRVRSEPQYSREGERKKFTINPLNLINHTQRTQKNIYIIYTTIKWNHRAMAHTKKGSNNQKTKERKKIVDEETSNETDEDPRIPLMVDIIHCGPCREKSEIRRRFDKFAVFIFHFLAHTHFAFIEFYFFIFSIFLDRRKSSWREPKEGDVERERWSEGSERGEWRIIWLGPNKRINPWINKKLFSMWFSTRSFCLRISSGLLSAALTAHTHRFLDEITSLAFANFLFSFCDVLGQQRKLTKENVPPKIPFLPLFLLILLRVFLWISPVGRINCE